MKFIQIFSQMHWSAILLLAIGMIFMIVEMFIPDFGFFGIMGLVCLVAGVIVRICQGVTIFQALMLILIVLLLYCGCFGLMIKTAKSGKLGKIGLFETKPSISSEYNQPNPDLLNLVGKFGKTTTDLNLAGRALIDGKIYDVVSELSFIEKHVEIEVLAVKDNTIVVMRKRHRR